MKIQIECATVNGIDDCLILKKDRYKFTEREIVEILYIVENYLNNQVAARDIPKKLNDGNKCSLCGREITKFINDYCPYCGQRMLRGK